MENGSSRASVEVSAMAALVSLESLGEAAIVVMFFPFWGLTIFNSGPKCDVETNQVHQTVARKCSTNATHVDPIPDILEEPGAK